MNGLGRKPLFAIRGPVELPREGKAGVSAVAVDRPVLLAFSKVSQKARAGLESSSGGI